jgi:ATP-dependent DNA helicase RecG
VAVESLELPPESLPVHGRATIQFESAENYSAELNGSSAIDSTTTGSELQRHLKSPEGARFELKEARSGFSFERLVQYVVARANERGGKIIRGGTDKRPRKIVGTHAFAEPGRAEAGLFERVRHHIPIEELTHDGRRLLIVHVAAREAGTVWQDSGVAWSRAGDALVPMTDRQRRLIYLETGDFSAELCMRATLAELDPAEEYPSRPAVRIRA